MWPAKIIIIFSLTSHFTGLIHLRWAVGFEYDNNVMVTNWPLASEGNVS